MGRYFSEELCNAYKRNEEWIAQNIQQEADIEAIKEKVWVEHLIEGYEAKIAKLNAALEKEQEWKPYEDKDHVSEEDYQALAHCSDTKFLNDEEAKQLLYDWYGKPDNPSGGGGQSSGSGSGGGHRRITGSSTTGPGVPKPEAVSMEVLKPVEPFPAEISEPERKDVLPKTGDRSAAPIIALVSCILLVVLIRRKKRKIKNTLSE